MDQVAEIREKIDLVALITESVPLKKAGRNFKAPCPFHTEKSPSFVVSPERQIWHCFGCGKGGDVYTFLMEYERLEFPEALRLLAKRTGVELENSRQSSGLSSKKERLYQVNSLAKEYYHYVLTKHQAGAKALEYLKNRGVSDKVIETFMLGFSPNTGSALNQYLINKKKYTREDLMEAGLVFQRGSGVSDFFRGRLMFPLIDHRDNVVGFSGRVMDGEDQTSKYINTRETLIYHKGEHFYGLSVTKDAIRRTNQAIIVEGEFDVISCFENGVANVVGVKGTALTESQVSLLGRFAQKITFCFDGDKAGQEAIKRSLVIVEKKNITPTVIEIPGGSDPDDALQKEPGLFKKAVKEDKGVYDYLFEQVFAKEDSETAEGKKKIADTLLPFLAEINNEIIKEHFIRKLSSDLDTSHESILKELDRLKRREAKAVVEPAAKVKRSQEEKMEEYLFALIMQSATPVDLAKEAIAIVSPFLPQEQSYQKLLYRLASFEGNDVANQFHNSLPDELRPSFNTSILLPLPQFGEDKLLENEVKTVARKLKLIAVQKKLKLLAVQIQQKEKEEDEAGAELLRKEYSELSTHIETAS
jgi:DNA primase